VCMATSQSHACMGVGRGVCEAKGAAHHSKLAGWCQHKMLKGMLKKGMQFVVMQVSCGCLVGHVCKIARNSVFAP
jgi:diphthamide synthase (EF-2-diphthine--ammonia ligase)